MLLGVSFQALATDAKSLKIGASTLIFEQNDEENFFPVLLLNNSKSYYQQLNPLVAEIVTSSDTYFVENSYETISMVGSTIVAKGQVKTKAGTIILFTDTYRTIMDRSFQISRSVVLSNAQSEDKGFSTRFSFQKDSSSSLQAYDFFVPSIWYKDNAYVPKHALASDYADNDFWFREDRLPLPIIMLRDKQSGLTFSIASHQISGTTFKEDQGSDRIIDARLQYSAVGLTNNTHPSIGVMYPGSEGNMSYIGDRAQSKKWALRSHPIQDGFQQNYSVVFSLSHFSSYAEALNNTWKDNYLLADPQLYSCNLETIYNQQIDVLNRYWKSINGAAGVPFRLLLDGTVESELDYNFNFGFVGHQPGNGYVMIREGIRARNDVLKDRGAQIIDFWAHNSITPSGCPKTWYDPYPQTWRGPEIALREVGDGALGILRAWNLEKQHGAEKESWLEACRKIANWVVGSQQADGSFYSHYDYNTGKATKLHTNCTSHIIPFLVEMYFATNEGKYKESALKAGHFIYDDLMNDYRYVGGAIDNPNVMDKEAASMALRAFLALYDTDESKQWMNAAIQTAYFYQTWVVAKDIPIPSDDSTVVFPAHRSVVGQSLIATGHSAADTYAAIDAFSFYRVYLLMGDAQMLHMSKLLQRNTKQFMNWDLENDPLTWIGEGLLGEAMNISVTRGRGVNYYLPWSTYNQLEPLVLFEDVFGHKDIESIESLSSEEKNEKHRSYSRSRMYEKIK